MCRCKQNRQVDQRGGQGVNRSCGRGYRAGKARAVQWSDQNWSGAWRCLCDLCRHFSGYCTVVSPVVAATGREARLCVGWKDCRKRPQPVQQNQKNGKDTPHRRFFIYGNRAWLSTSGVLIPVEIIGALRNFYQFDERVDLSKVNVCNIVARVSRAGCTTVFRGRPLSITFTHIRHFT